MSNKIVASNGAPQGIIDVIDGAVGYTSLINGFTGIEYVMEDIAIKSLSYAESAGRTKILLSDIVLSLIDFGFDVRNLLEIPKKFLYRGFKDPVSIEEPKQQAQTVPKNKGISHTTVFGPGGIIVMPKPLSLKPEGAVNGVVPLSPLHLRLPPLPQVHTYVSSRVRRPNVGSDPINLRRKLLDQGRKVQSSLTKFLARIVPVKQLFPSDPESLPLLLPKESKRPYVSALLADSECLDENKPEDGKLESPNAKRARLSDNSKESSDISRNFQNFYLEKTKFPSA